jgi:integrase
MGIVVAMPTPTREKNTPDRVAFTEQRLGKLAKPAKGAVYVYDTEEPGLCVRLTPSASAFVFYRWHNGQPGRITIAKVGDIPLREARAIAAGYRGDLARGADVFAGARRARNAPRPATLANAYAGLISRPDMRPSTLRDYASLWRLVPSRMRARALADIQSPELAELHGEVGSRHPRTANKLAALLSVLFTRNGRRHDNPVADITRFREAPRQRVLSVAELQRLRAALEEEHEPWRSFFLLAMLTGARRGALARMQWADIDLEAAVWRIPAVWSKNRRVLTVALATEAVAVLRVMQLNRGAAAWVFPSRSKAGHLTEPTKAWRRIAKCAGIEGAVIHDLRRTMGTAVAADGAGAAMISAVLGHLSTQSAKSYLHLSAEMARGAMEKAAARSRRSTDTP